MVTRAKFHRYLLVAGGIALAFLVVAGLAGCNDSGTTNTSASSVPQCDPSSPSIIPPPSGKPQLVEFYRDT
jgi:hypothetical protein